MTTLYVKLMVTGVSPDFPNRAAGSLFLQQMLMLKIPFLISLQQREQVPISVPYKGNCSDGMQIYASLMAELCF